MYVAINRQYLQSLGYNIQHITLNNGASCGPDISLSYIIFLIPFEGCGTFIEEKNDTIIYYNVIFTSQTDAIITRKRIFHLHLFCKMRNNNMVEVKYLTDGSIDISRSQDGHYHLNASFYKSSLFEHPVIESPYYVELNQDVFLQIVLSYLQSNLILSVDTCVASPYADGFRYLTYDLIRNRCVKDSSYSTYSSPSPNIVRFSFKVFRFLKHHNEVYLQCRMLICKASASSQCLRGCTSKPKRETQPDWDHLDIVVGPIRLKKETSLDKKPAMDG
ncbi:deleted in malignant brain tumors 1 protein-like [Monodelphis domestica]|uniref:deleted in malignant brain tumors 1 protein-like n=1 Tax=Monodelphis domestica TaxID=13616 RepID=UPI0024E1E18B|nr:deleted in malignant brain tumors 1 protein-like [Monodelphis domestica]